ncbi:hypothetical protein RJ639_001475 [Escallonia herrerae]|uniref:AAA+ ATPase domain-containing protein n=1 Tax=Escallonia herrerae TaxID=1293975 RepID=A0AA88XG11_9ASTE|nr:hypothetical protein RJ639_001475 [Escallonia herrerae]
MADIALSAVTTMAVEIAVNLVNSEGSGLYWSQENINWIEREMKRIQSYLEDADAKEVRGRGVANLINDIKGLAHDVDDVLDTFLPQMASRKRKTDGFTHFAMEIEKIRQGVADIDRSRTTYGITSDGDRAEKDAWDSRCPFLHADEQHIIGFDKDIQKLEAKLLNVESKYDVISIVGMPGLGKTTLAKKVFKSIKHRFECSAMVYVSQEPNPREIKKDKARQVGLDQKEKREEYLETSLYEFLEVKRYIIMLDDIWENETWDALKICIPVSFANGGRILLTPRNTGVGRNLGRESFLHELVPLNPNDSWKLFSKMVMDPLGNTDEVCVPPELTDVRRQIVERCGGLPLAIVLTTSLLLSREKTEHAWKGVLGSMGQGEGDKLTKILDLSYKDLPIRLKPCFLYFGLFPESHEISVFQLVNLWVADKLISASETSGDRTVEDMGEDYLNNLVSRNLIQMKQLRHLILPATVVFHTPIVGVCKIKNRDMLPIEASLPDLQTLFLVCDDRLKANWLYTFNLYKLHLEGSMGKLPNPDTFPPNLTKLTLRMTAFDEESMEAMKKLPNLRILKMQEGSYKSKLEVPSEYGITHSHENKGFTSCFKSVIYMFSHCYTAYKLAREIDKVRRRLEETDRARAANSIINDGPNDERERLDSRRLFLHADEPVINVFDKMLKVLEAKLLNIEIEYDLIFKIVSMPGIGKTIPAKKLFNTVDSRFQCSALVYVSQEPNTKEIM